jgi:hypothetical protein
MPVAPSPTLADTTLVTEAAAAAAAALLQALLRDSEYAKPRPWSFGLDLSTLASYPRIHALSATERLALAKHTVALFKKRAPTKPAWRIDQQLTHELEKKLLAHLLNFSTDFQPADYVALLYSYLPTETESAHFDAFSFPVELTLTQLGQRLGTAGPPPDARAALRQLLDEPAFRATHHDYGLRAALQQLVALADRGIPRRAKGLFSAGDSFGQLLIAFASTPIATPYVPLLELWAQASSSKPTRQFLKLAGQHVQAIGPAAFEAQAIAWLEFLQRKEHDVHSHPVAYGRYDYALTDETYLAPANLTAAKGLAWSLLGLGTLSEPLLHAVAELAAKCYRKHPGVGPWCAILGNACVYTLAQCGLPGAAHLARLRAKATNRNIQVLLDKRIGELAAALGLTPADLDDLSIPTHGLVAGRVEYTFPNYTAHLVLSTPTKAELRWFKADGSPLKTAPAALKKAQPADVKALQKTLLHVQQTLLAQRDRLERAYLADRRWSYERFASCYLHHALVGPLAQGLIWRFSLPDGTQHDALWRENAWRDAAGQPLPDLGADTQVQLWHPVLSPAAEVLAWRTLLDQYQMRQPFKQAYREVYVLTPPEERTNTYSNRMAAHILKQHQVSALAKQRGWAYHLMGGFDHGSNGTALELPAHQLRAEFWLTEAALDDTTGMGIYQYVATDQVRFTRHYHDVVPLPEVPPLVFSEVMRDVDLFVGVASVGNDPNWRDNGGQPAHHTYWESYSFGELGEVAKNRKLALERLVPRLKIGKVSELKDRFLVVRGKLRTYKIHLGSGNILMEPNDQYLCIVPDRSAKETSTTDVFLPFEGDAVLSIILSKALLLMDDDKITDETIVRQLTR